MSPPLRQASTPNPAPRRAEAKARHDALSRERESVHVHPATIPLLNAGIVAGFFIGRLFGGIIGGLIALGVWIIALIVVARTPRLREPAIAGAGALLIGLLGILIVAWLNS